MFKSSLVVISLCLSLAGFGQKVKSQNFTPKYSIPAQYVDKVPAHYNFKVIETLNVMGGTEEKVFNTHAQAKAVDKDFYMNVIRAYPFKRTDVIQSAEETDTISQITMTTSEAIYTNKKNFKENVTKDGKVVGQKWSQKFTIEIPTVITYHDEKGVERLKYDKAHKFTLTFPRDFKSFKDVSYASEKALENALVLNAEKIKMKHRLNYYIKYGNIASKYIQNTFNDKHKLFFNCQFYYIKGVKKTKDQYNDFIAVMEKLETVFEKIAVNHDERNMKNWHTEEIQNDFKSIKEDFNAILSKESNDDKAGSGRMDDETFIKMYKNIMWCNFFMNEFENVRKEAAGIHGKKYNLSEEEAEIDIIETGMGTYYRIVEITQSYQHVYETRGERMGW